MRRERGFTLIEMMIVVAVIAILAAIVVPTFFRESAKTKASSEVTPMLSELSLKLEAFKSDTGRYTGPSLVAGSPETCPTTTTTAGVAASTCATGLWADLRVNPAQQTLRCKYTVEAGDVGDSVSTSLPTGLAFTAPTTTGWWLLLAECDSDGQGAPYHSFMMTSVNSAIQEVNKGQ